LAKRPRVDLVVQHVEKMPRRLLEQHQEVVREFIKGKVGVYALYKKKQLHYVGLASDLRSRLKTHFRDRHGESWDAFSIYLTASSDHLRELEALMIRIARPRGNRSTTKFPGSQDLRRYFKRRILERQKRELNTLFGPTQAEARAARQAPKGGKAPSLQPFITRRMRIRWPRKDTTHNAIVLADGRIKFKGKIFNSPSPAAKHVTKRAMNGWDCWRYEIQPGKWVRLNELRLKPKRRRK
jgi:hypothetical protein